MSTSSANDHQIGGSHYQRADGEQHWDRIWRLYGRGYFVGCITKYVERYQNKNGIEDLEKAKHFLEKLIELETADENEGLAGYVCQDHIRQDERGNVGIGTPGYGAPEPAPAPTPAASSRKRR